MSIEGTEPALPGSGSNPGGSLKRSPYGSNTSLLAPVVLGCGLDRYLNTEPKNRVFGALGKSQST